MGNQGQRSTTTGPGPSDNFTVVKLKTVLLSSSEFGKINNNNNNKHDASSKLSLSGLLSCYDFFKRKWRRPGDTFALS